MSTQAEANVDTTGMLLNASTTSVTVSANADVSVSGLSITSTIGSSTAKADFVFNATGQSMNMLVGQAFADDASAEITGISMTASIGTVKNIIWTEVDTGVDATWIEVDTAA